MGHGQRRDGTMTDAVWAEAKARAKSIEDARDYGATPAKRCSDEEWAAATARAIASGRFQAGDDRRRTARVIPFRRPGAG